MALLRWFDYWHFIRSGPGEIYGAVIAIAFTLIGLYLGFRWKEKRLVVRSGPTTGGRIDDTAIESLGITPREHEILGLIAEGMSNREIGEKLFVSENTVKTHSSRIFQKLDVRRRTAAVARARELGVIR